jgi:YVTN family beta-propeller protein
MQPSRLVLRLLTVASLLLAGGMAHANGLAYVLNSGAASISVVDMARRQEIRRIPVLREPHHVVATPDGKEILVGDSAANELFAIDPRTGVTTRRIPVANPYHLGFSPDGKLLVVNGLARNQVDVYDAARMQLLKRFPLRSMPSHLAFTPDSRQVFITLQGTDQLAAIDLEKMEVLWVQPVGAAPAGILWNRGKLLVANMGGDDMAVVNPADGRVERRMLIGRGTHQVFPTPDGKQLYVNSRLDGAVTVLNAETLDVIRIYRVPGGPDCLEIAPDGKVWITRRWAEKVAVLDPVTGTYETVNVGRSPHGIFLAPTAVP